MLKMKIYVKDCVCSESLKNLVDLEVFDFSGWTQD